MESKNKFKHKVKVPYFPYFISTKRLRMSIHQNTPRNPSSLKVDLAGVARGRPCMLRRIGSCGRHIVTHVEHMKIDAGININAEGSVKYSRASYFPLNPQFLKPIVGIIQDVGNVSELYQIIIVRPVIKSGTPIANRRYHLNCGW